MSEIKGKVSEKGNTGRWPESSSSHRLINACDYVVEYAQVR